MPPAGEATSGVGVDWLARSSPAGGARAGKMAAVPHEVRQTGDETKFGRRRNTLPWAPPRLGLPFETIGLSLCLYCDFMFSRAHPHVSQRS